jgi:branched-chain amino acid transport system substrate-binding protein
MRIMLACVLLCLAGGCMPLLPPAPPAAMEERGEGLFFEAEDLYHRQEYRRALKTYEEYLLRRPQGAKARQARLREAEILGLLGDWHGALIKYQALLQRDLDADTALKARYGVGRANFKLGRFHQAQEVLESLTALELPGSLRFSTHALLAEIALKKGEVEAAFARLRLAGRDAAAGDQEWFDDLQARVVEQATPAQLEQLADLYRDSPLTAPLLLRLARLAQEQGREAEARKWLETLKSRFPDSKEARTAEASLAAARPVLGCLVPLSGEYAEFGKHLEQGLTLGAQGTRFELAIRNCPNDPAAAARLVQELAQDPRVVAVLGPLTSGDAPAAAQAAQAAGLPLIALSQKADLTSTGPLVFQIFLTPRLQVRALLDYALRQGLTRFALLAPESPYGRTWSRMFQEELAARGGILTAQATYAPEAEDLAEVLTSLLEAYNTGMAGGTGLSGAVHPR